ncbi:MAG: hypothetical protein OQK75_09175 [Gammaproteobacteria bacterium]|nr:hypothetical protein [Gammaproteobacteria bacterium]MCW8987823.1 hypothetical protein [Gammaproteobacteria bacterium]MCW9030507.1 hypothetical protein [Gammaproteobacteria bacterium]
MSLYSVDKLISEARRIAAEYRRATGKPLGISAEIACHDACTYLDLEANEEAVGYDAIGLKGERAGNRFQIKGRAIFDEQKGGQRLGQIKIDQDWDEILLVLMNEEFETTEIYEASRQEILEDLDGAGLSSRQKRGIMSVARFKRLAHLVWNKDEGLIESEVWNNQTGTTHI